MLYLTVPTKKYLGDMWSYWPLKQVAAYSISSYAWNQWRHK